MQLGFSCHGKDLLPKYGEMTPEVIRKYFFGDEADVIHYETETVVDRPPTRAPDARIEGSFMSLANIRK